MFIIYLLYLDIYYMILYMKIALNNYKIKVNN